MLRVPCFVEEIRAEDEIPRSRAEQRLRIAPADPRSLNEDPVALGVPPQQLDRVLGPVGREDVGAAQRGGERGQPEPAAELENAQPVRLELRDVPREGETARPELGPVGQELLLVERRLVDQLLRARRTEDVETQSGRELDLLLDEAQSVANRLTGTPSGSLSCA